MTKRFVTAADEVWRLQRGTDPECRFFQGFADRGHYQGPQGTRQGIYVIAPSGKLLTSLNALDPAAVRGALRDSLKRWHTLPPNDRHLAQDAEIRPDHRWEASLPEGGLALRIISRDLPRDGRCSSQRSDRWNRDHVWFTAEEARGWLPTELAVGATVDLPDVILQRLARFHFVDNVRGQTLPFAPEEIAGSRIRTQIVGFDRHGSLRLRIQGAVNGACRGKWRLGQNDWTPPKRLPSARDVSLIALIFRPLALPLIPIRRTRLEKTPDS